MIAVSAQLSAASPNLTLTPGCSARWTHSNPALTYQIYRPAKIVSADSRKAQLQRLAKAASKASSKPNIVALLSGNLESVPVGPLSYSYLTLLSTSLGFTPHLDISNSFEIEIQDLSLPDGTILRRRQPLVVLASISDPDDCFHADIPDLDISLAAANRAEMLSALQDLIVFLWQEYALEDDANLTPKAQQLKACLLRDYAVAS